MTRREKAIANAAIVATMEKPERKQAVVPAIADAPVKIPRDVNRHVLKNYDYDTVQPYINRQMLIGHHLGLKGKVAEMIKEGNEKAISLNNLVDDLVDFVKKDEDYGINAVYQFFPAQSNGNKVLIYNPENHTEVLEEFDFPRQATSPYLCLADFVKPVSSGEMDYAGFFVVTAGRGIRKWADKWKEEGDFLKSHAIQALALETAEGFAERIHQLMRDSVGISDPIDMTMKDRFAAKYIGQRFSFGYPACPNLEDQEKLFRLLKPEDIGVQLTEGFMMEPEASVSAIVFAHPEARYFNVER